MSFVHSIASGLSPDASDICLVTQGDLLLVSSDGDLPAHARLDSWAGAADKPLHLGTLGGKRCWSRSLSGKDTPAPQGLEWREARTLVATLSEAEVSAIACARELHWWEQRTRFCGACGSPTEDLAHERGKRCPKCGSLFFPGASTAVIVAVSRGDKILLAHNKTFKPGLFSLVAGFVDPGETLEHAVAREVREETGLEISGLRYVMSQPWPFPNSLMAGFVATYESGEIVVDGKEIEEAGWFSRDALPDIPRPGTVANKLITYWKTQLRD